MTRAHGDAAGGKPRHRALEKRRAAGAVLVCKDLDVGDAAVIIDGDVDVFPPITAHASPTVAMDAVPDAGDAAEGFDIDVQQIARRRPLVALHGHRRPARSTIESQATQPRPDRRARHAEGPADRPRRESVLFAELPDRCGRRLVRRAMRPRRPVLQRGRAAVTKSLDPFGDGAHADPMPMASVP